LLTVAKFRLLVWAIDLDDLNGTSINALGAALGKSLSMVTQPVDMSAINDDLGGVVQKRDKKPKPFRV
jgi:hypothetical protein